MTHEKTRRRRRGRRQKYPDLATYLEQSGDTQAQVAAMTGTTQAYISRILRGHAIPRPQLALKIAEYANVPLDSFARQYMATQIKRPA
jgi:transcriptional regulator with XRE-family HTH domain